MSRAELLAMVKGDEANGTRYVLLPGAKRLIDLNGYAVTAESVVVPA